MQLVTRKLCRALGVVRLVSPTRNGLGRVQQRGRVGLAGGSVPAAVRGCTYKKARKLYLGLNF